MVSRSVTPGTFYIPCMAGVLGISVFQRWKQHIFSFFFCCWSDWVMVYGLNMRHENEYRSLFNIPTPYFTITYDILGHSHTDLVVITVPISLKIVVRENRNDTPNIK
ncbi:hypothetical protein GGS20DRAFT_310736 [Poronia punctata]|nr:hypothetical protein GGS20DRAFT_310736 [Poronia punctata]